MAEEWYCRKCGGTGRIPVECPDNRPGCAVAHYRLCSCKMTLKQRNPERNEELE